MKKILIQEANLFCDWYLKNIPRAEIKKFSKDFRKIIKKLASKLILKENILFIEIFMCQT